MQRLSQVSLHFSPAVQSGVLEDVTPLQADHDELRNTNDTMPRTKVVVTRQLIGEAQRLLDAKQQDLEIVQWPNEKVRCGACREERLLADALHAALRPDMVAR